MSSENLKFDMMPKCDYLHECNKYLDCPNYLLATIQDNLLYLGLVLSLSLFYLSMYNTYKSKEFSYIPLIFNFLTFFNLLTIFTIFEIVKNNWYLLILVPVCTAMLLIQTIMYHKKFYPDVYDKDKKIEVE